MSISDKLILTGPDYKAKLKASYCKSTYDCIAACPEKAIIIGAERMPAGICLSEGGYKMLPGKAQIDADKCTGCGECISVCPNNALEMVERRKPRC